MLSHDAAHRICRLFLHFGGNVGICPERESRVEVARHTGDGLDLHAVRRVWAVQKDISETSPACADPPRLKPFSVYAIIFMAD